MKNSKIISLIEQLDSELRKKITRHLTNAATNHLKRQSQLWQFLLRSLDKQHWKKMSEEAFADCFPQMPYDATKLRLLVSNLSKTIEHILVEEAFSRDPYNHHLYLSKVYRQLNLTKHLRHTLRTIENIHAQNPYRDTSYYEAEYQIQYERFLGLHGSQRSKRHNLQEVSDALDTAYIVSKLKHTCYLMTRMAVYHHHHEFGMLPIVLDYIKQHELLKVPAIRVYYHAFQSLSKPESPTHFLALQDTLTSIQGVFQNEEMGDLYLLAINYCIRKINDGFHSYVETGLTLYQQGLQKTYFLKEGRLSHFTYSNIAAMGIKNQQFEWVRTFLETYRPLLAPKYRASTYALCKARLLYEEKAFNEVISLLQKVSYDDLLTSLVAKTLLLKVFYENKNYDLLSAHIDAMNIFLIRKKVLGYHKKNYQTILKYTRKLLHKETLSSNRLKKIIQQIEEEPVFSEKNWFLEKFLA